MTTRERNLATALLCIVLLGGLFMIAKAVYLDPAAALDKQIGERNAAINAKKADYKLEQDYITRIKDLSPRLGKWNLLSLPRGDTNTRAAESHVNILQNRYQGILKGLLEKSRFQRLTFTPQKPDVRSAPQLGQGQPMYTVLSFSFEGETDMKGIVDFFVNFYEVPLLHQIKSFTIESQRTSNNLAVKNMIVEVLMVDDKLVQHISKRNGGILATFDKDKNKLPPILSPSGRKYQDIVAYNPFMPAPTTGPGPGPVEPVNPEPVYKEKPADVYPFVRLSMIAYSEYYDAWVARIYNPSNKNDFNKSMLVCDKPLPSGTRFQLDKKLAEKNKDLAEQLREPTTRYQVRNIADQMLLDMQIVRIDPLRIIFQANGELRILRLDDDDLGRAMDEDPLSKDEIKKLGLTSGREETLKKIVLKELKYRKDRDYERKQLKGYEATFVNPDNKEEMVLATETLETDSEAPEDWAVKDRFGADLVSLRVLLLTKNEVYFKADKKFYRIKQGESLADAMAKPISDADAKELKLPGAK